MTDKKTVPVTEYETTMLRVLNATLTTMIQEAPRGADSHPLTLDAVRDVAYQLSAGRIECAHAAINELVMAGTARAARAGWIAKTIR